MNSIQVVLKFEQAINAHSPEAICALMTADGIFVDSLDNRIEGTTKLRAAWEGYFKMVPDYSISHAEIFADGNTVAVFGSAQGTFSKDGTLEKQNFWKTPGAWRAVVIDARSPSGRSMPTTNRSGKCSATEAPGASCRSPRVGAWWIYGTGCAAPRLVR